VKGSKADGVACPGIAKMPKKYCQITEKNIAKSPKKISPNHRKILTLAIICSILKTEEQYEKI